MNKKSRTTAFVVLTFFLIFSGFQNVHAYGKFPNCNPNTTPDSKGRWVDGGTTPWMCFTVSSVQFTGNPIQLAGHGVITQLDVRGQIAGTPCKILTPDCDGHGFSFWQLTLNKDSPINYPIDQLIGPQDESCELQALLQSADRFISTDQQPVYIVRPILDQQSAENNLNGSFDIKIPIYIPANCPAGSYHLSAEWSSGSWSGGMGMIGIQGNSISIAIAAKSTIPQPQSTPLVPAVGQQTRSTDSSIPTVEPVENTGNSISIVRTGSKLTKIEISSDFPNTKLRIIATSKSSKKKLTFNIGTDLDGNFSFKTSTNLRGYTLILLNGPSELDRVLG